MMLSREGILVHADRRFGLPASSVPEEWLEAFKSFLKIETERLRIRHRLGMGGAELAAARSYLVDLVVCRAWQLAVHSVGAVPDGCAVIAIGGYGRGELAPGSDVDLLFLRDLNRDEAARCVEDTLKLLWDVGLTVGHSFRTVGECVAMAREDLHSRNAVADARLLCGNPVQFTRLARALERGVYRKDRETEAFLEAMRAEREERYAKFGRVVCLQEPNVKESAGGLRDLHSVMWVAHARHRCRSLEDLRATDLISGAEYATARRAYDFLLRARHEAHFSTSRRSDLLTLELQPVLAENLGFEARRGMAASEIFMREYYKRAQALHQFADSFLVRAGRSRRRPYFRPRARKVGGGRLEVREGRLHLAEGAELDGLAELLEVFAVAQEEGVPLADELRLATRARLALVDRRARSSREAGRSFLELLRGRRPAAVLRMMYEVGLLGRLLPEFQRITFLVQHDHYHKYTVDEHTLKALEALDEMVERRDDAGAARFQHVLDQIEDRATLYLGLLLHDVGKGRGGGHSARGARLAEVACRRLGMERRQASDTVFLVRQHLTMSEISQRRDITDEDLVQSFADQVGSLNRLNLLLLLTYADHCGVGPGIWNDWKATLLWELYARARARLSARDAEAPAEDRRQKIRERMLRSLSDEFPLSEIERHLALLPERYLRATSLERMLSHFRLVHRLESRPLVAEWRTAPDQHYTELTIVARDAHGLLARLAGTFTAHAVNILSVEVYTREDGIVLDTFRLSDVASLRPVAASRWPALEAALEGAVEGGSEVAQAVERWQAKSRLKVRRRAARPPVVRFDSEASASATVIEVRAEDEPGLVFRIAATLAGLGLDVSFAKIATGKSLALDVFYVTDAKGGKLPASRLATVQTALVDALDPATRVAAS